MLPSVPVDLRKYDNYDSYENFSEIPERRKIKDRLFFIKSLNTHFRYDEIEKVFVSIYDSSDTDTKLIEIKNLINQKQEKLIYLVLCLLRIEYHLIPLDQLMNVLYLNQSLYYHQQLIFLVFD